MLSSFRRKARDVWWSLRHRFDPRHRYNVVHTGLRPGYYDVDARMLHAVMALVVSYVEEERGGKAELLERIGWLSDGSQHRGVDAKMIEEGGYAKFETDVLSIYDWWKTELPRDKAREGELTHVLFGKGLMFSDAGNGLQKLEIPYFTDEEEVLLKELRALEKKIEDDETRYMKLAVELRKGMWT